MALNANPGAAHEGKISGYMFGDYYSVLSSDDDADADIKNRNAFEIRRIYFHTTERTIHDDLTHAIKLLKSLPSEEEREKATVYMDGLAQMCREWARNNAP